METWMSGGSDVGGVHVCNTDLVSPGWRSISWVPTCAGVRLPSAVLISNSTEALAAIAPKFWTLAVIVLGTPACGGDDSVMSAEFSHGWDGECSAQGAPG